MKKIVSFLVVAALLFSMILPLSVSAYNEEVGDSAKIRVKGTDFVVGKWDRKIWMNGVNTPWISWNEFASAMNNNAWTRKELNTFQGSWTELKHDTLLYAKAAMAEMGGGEAPERPDDRGYVEPNPTVFGRLAALVKQTKTGLRQRDILTPEADEALGVLYELSAADRNRGKGTGKYAAFRRGL